MKFEAAQWATIMAASIAAAVAVAGWHWSNSLTADREFKNRRRELTTQYLIDAYQKLALASNRVPPGGTLDDAMPTGQYADWFEESITKIQLLGSPAEIGALHQAIDHLDAMRAGKAGNAPSDDLLQTLRRTLRTELQLEPIESKIRQVRIPPDKR